MLVEVRIHLYYLDIGQNFFYSTMLGSTLAAPFIKLSKPFKANLVPSMFTVNRSPLRLLFVNQVADICSVYETLFETFGCVVAVAHSGKMALSLAETFQPHAIYMSLELGDMRGSELCVLLKKLDITRDVVLVAVTGHARRTVAQNGLCVGFDHCIMLPVSLLRLILPLASIPNITANLVVSAVTQEAQPTPESQAYAAFREIILGR